jgi:hypothetical protein
MNSARVQQVVDEQADDEGLWCKPETIVEDYLQKALRRLHRVCEGEPDEESPGGSIH